MDWPQNPKVTVTVENNEAIFRSPVFVHGVCLDLDGERAIPDNYFDLYPNQDYRLPWTDKNTPQILHTGNLPQTT